MYTTFTIALLASVSMARGLGSQDKSAFGGYAALYNKHYTSTTEMNHRLEIWKANKQRVADLNAKNGNNGVRFGENETSDMTDAEFGQRQGIVKPAELPNGKPFPEQANNGSTDGRGGRGGRGLQSGTDQSINWVTQGKVHEVKNQGSCGSCWAFAAATVQESMQAIKNNAPVERLSEQEGVDCDPQSYGCQGGWMSYYWQMSANIGSSSNVDYPYEATDNECRKQGGKMIYSRANMDSYGSMSTVPEMKQKLQQGPLSIAVSAGNDCWRFYQSGILSSANNCPTALDHGVVVVGLEESGNEPYWLVQNSWGAWWGDQGFIKLAVEDGEGVSGMNTVAEYMDVEEGYPRESDPVENCDHDETQNPGGAHTCTSDDMCQGLRTCSEWGWCQGTSGCEEEEKDDDTQPDPQPDKCDVDESLNPLGPSQCSTSAECQGDRYCSEFGWCQGEANCDEEEDNVDPDDDDISPTPDDSCAIDEMNSEIFRENRCVFSSDCRGNRWCNSDNWCEGDHGCDDSDGTTDQCKVDESIHPWGPGRCQSDDQCTGARVCCQEYYYCVGDSWCDDDN